VVKASNGWEARQQTAVGEYDALVIDCALCNMGCETLRKRLKALGVRAPALVLTARGSDQRSARSDNSYPR
jgi:DNA-binding response OmpR family regulator